MRRIAIEERRARLAVRHHLALPATDTVQAARGVVALHATDPASVFLSTHARTAPIEVDAIEHALYGERSLIRMLGMRRTMFVVPVELAAVIQAACTREIAARQRRTYTKLLSEAGVGDGAWLREVEDATEKALVARGEATGAQLSADEPRLRTQLLMAEGKAYASRQNITTWVLFMLAAEGRIVRGRPRGSWTSSQYHWSPAQTWLPGGMPALPVEGSRVELVRRWLEAFGPGTVADLKWWTGWTAGQVKHALAAIGPVEVELDGQVGLVLADDVDMADPAEHWVALLPALDPTAMGWSERSWYLGPHGPALFDRSGNIGPTIWADGRIVGGWAQRPTGEIACRLFDDVGRDVTAEVESRAAQLAEWIGAVRVTPRFRTPLERELSA
ncbi:MAG TPA: winged helix DNA-binding domain-containing protein [Jiangellaceae bacterium]|nr:winged helix DNA-binding domain-containing protein [Jiangellaceae bacterium]